jgi:hypothetical protein
MLPEPLSGMLSTRSERLSMTAERSFRLLAYQVHHVNHRWRKDMHKQLYLYINFRIVDS